MSAQDEQEMPVGSADMVNAFFQKTEELKSKRKPQTRAQRRQAYTVAMLRGASKNLLLTDEGCIRLALNTRLTVETILDSEDRQDGANSDSTKSGED